MNASFNNNAINIYLVNSLFNTYGQPLYGSAFEIPSNMLAVINSRASSSTIAHELGHCLNLLHTFQGTAENTSGCAEIPSSNNCSLSINGDICGDKIEDTPADKNEGVINGYCPDLTNIMSYYPNTNNFTPGQEIRMRDAIYAYPILNNAVSNLCAIATIIDVNEGNGELTACYSNTITTTLSIVNGNPPYNWTVSSNLDILEDNGSSIVIRANTSEKGFVGQVSCTYGNPSQTKTKPIWLNTPFAPSSISGPSTVTYDALVNYQCGIAEGAKYYLWWLPYPFDVVQPGEPPYYFHENWWMFENNTRYIQAYTADGSAGDRNGYVQAMGANKCGPGSAKYIQVTQGTGGQGGIRIVAYPNEADDELNIDLNQMPSGTLYVYLYDSTYNLVYYGEQTNDTIKTINTLNLNEGTYFLQVYDGVTIETKQIFINH